MLKRVKLLISIIFIAAALSVSVRMGWAYKIHPNAGNTSAAFLKIPPGGRGVAMGEAQAGIESDVFGMWWNPASIARLGKRRIGVSYNRWFQNMSKNFVGGVMPIYKDESIGIMIDSLIIKNDIEKRSGTGEDDPYYQLTPSEGEFGAYDLMVAGLYARKLSRKLYGGVALKGILQCIDKEKAYGAGFDIGIQHTGIDLWKRTLFFGASIRNFGTAIKFENEAYNLPLDYNLGVGTFLIDDLLMALDLHQAIDNYLKIHTGFEYRIWNKLFLRTGYIYRLTGNPLGDFSGFRGGFGVEIGNIILDYSYAPYSYLGESHRISFQAVFGKSLKARYRKPFIKRKAVLKKDIFPEDKQLNVQFEPLSINPASISWYVSCEKSTGVIRKISIITNQDDVAGTKFSIVESTSALAGFDVPLPEKEALYYIGIDHNLERDLIRNCRIEFVIEEDIGNLEITDKYLNELKVIKVPNENNKYFIYTVIGDLKKIIILKNE
ncbi:MAG: PorV/PorQ family protein [Elusimicrobiota bacterium]